MRTLIKISARLSGAGKYSGLGLAYSNYNGRRIPDTMTEWLIENIPTILAALVLAAIIAIALRNKFKTKGCGCGCAGCPGCDAHADPKPSDSEKGETKS